MLINTLFAVADPGFDLRMGGGLCQRGRGGGRKSLKVLAIEVKSFVACFCHISIKTTLKINRERSERKK